MLEKKRWSKEVYEFLIGFLDQKPSLVAFDFDNTIIHGDFGDQVMWKLVENELLDIQKILDPLPEFFTEKNRKTILQSNPTERVAEIQKIYHEIVEKHGMIKGYSWTSFLFSHLTESALLEFSRKLWNDNLQNYRQSPDASPQFVSPYPEILNLLENLQQKGFETYIVTSSPSLVIQATCETIPVPKENVLGMDLQLDKSGRTTREIVEPYPCGEGKKTALLKRAQRNPNLVFGDSWNDFGLFGASQNVIVIDRKLEGYREAVQKFSPIFQPRFVDVRS